MDEKLVKIYALSSSLDPERYRYIGKTEQTLDKRLRDHIYQAKNKKNKDYKSNWIKSQIKRGDIIIIELDEVPYEKWEEAERAYIRLFKSLGANLTNIAEGGAGVKLDEYQLKKKRELKAFTRENKIVKEKKQKVKRALEHYNKYLEYWNKIPSVEPAIS